MEATGFIVIGGCLLVAAFIYDAFANQGKCAPADKPSLAAKIVGLCLIGFGIYVSRSG